MLCLSLAPGEYLTIGGNVVVQLDSLAGDRCKLMVNAPKEIPVLRGTLLERNGGRRPDCVFGGPRRHRSEIPWNRSKAQALNAMRKLLSEMDGQDDTVKALRSQLNHMFPPTDKTSVQEKGKEAASSKRMPGNCPAVDDDSQLICGRQLLAKGASGT